MTTRKYKGRMIVTAASYRVFRPYRGQVLGYGPAALRQALERLWQDPQVRYPSHGTAWVFRYQHRVRDENPYPEQYIGSLAGRKR